MAFLVKFLIFNFAGNAHGFMDLKIILHAQKVHLASTMVD